MSDISDLMTLAKLEAQRDELLKVLEAEERAQWAVRNLQSISDPLDDRILGLRMEVERTRHEANSMRRDAIAKAKGVSS